MLRQSVLDLTPDLTFLPPASSATQSPRRAEYRWARSARGLARRTVPDLENLAYAGVWRLAPYRGSEYESPFESAPSKAANRQILVNQRLPKTLRRALSARRDGRLSIAIGDRFEAYPRAERDLGVTRSVLEVLEEFTGFEIELTTRAPLVLRDQDLLRRLDLKHTVAVTIPIATLEADLSARLEPNQPGPAARFEIVRNLSRDGIGVTVAFGPIVRGINDSIDEMVPLFDRALGAGALDVVSDARGSKTTSGHRLAEWLEEHYPERASAILESSRRHPAPTHRGTLERLRLSYGFPVSRAGRG